MVTFINLSRFPGPHPASEDADRFIQYDPIYPLEELKALAAANHISTVTRKAIADVAALGFENDELAQIILSLNENQHKHAEWCQNSRSPSPGITLRQGWIACDVYVFRHTEYNEVLGKSMHADYYLKCGISVSGNIVLVVSCHLS